MNPTTFINNIVSNYVKEELARVSSKIEFKILSAELIFCEDELYSRYDELMTNSTDDSFDEQLQAEFDILEAEVTFNEGKELFIEGCIEEYQYCEDSDMTVEEWQAWVIYEFVD